MRHIYAKTVRRLLLILVLCLFLGLLTWWARSGNVAKTVATPLPATALAHAPLSAPSAPEIAPPSLPAPAALAASVVSAPPTPVNDSSGPRFKRAYILQLDQGALTLVEQQNIEGDFAPPRRPPEEWSGMLRLRLLSATNTVLAEEIIPAPDHICTVLDSHDTSGAAAIPVQYTTHGPVVFQARLPRHADATQLAVSRITTPGDPTRDTALGTLALPPL
jgi:hypothetical protein